MAPSDGTVYLIEETTGKIIETDHINEGKYYRISILDKYEINDQDEILGIKISKIKFSLYFKAD